MKLLIVGDSGVGKTSLITRYFNGFFETNTIPTIGYDFTTKLYTKGNSKMCKLQIWDIAGQERYQAVSKLYARNAAGCVVVSDITNLQTLQNTIKWKKIIQEHCDSVNQIPFILVQNKVDLIIENVSDFMTEEYLKTFAQNNGFIACYQTSAKKNTNLDELFETLVEKSRETLIKNQETVDYDENTKSLQKISNKYSRDVTPRNDNSDKLEFRNQKKTCCFF